MAMSPSVTTSSVMGSIFVLICMSMLLFLGEEKDAEAVGGAAPAGRQHGDRTGFLDDRRPVECSPRSNLCAVVDRCRNERALEQYVAAARLRLFQRTAQRPL